MMWESGDQVEDGAEAGVDLGDASADAWGDETQVTL